MSRILLSSTAKQRLLEEGKDIRNVVEAIREAVTSPESISVPVPGRDDWDATVASEGYLVVHRKLTEEEARRYGEPRDTYLIASIMDSSDIASMVPALE
ncbi:hypothetical protein AB0B45_31985 [Nonomuraea sp. NPDC049152]|uniref:hypothetical protein n=1 Tax=Nonomuraea sp. NPDC049152 TaxID=3154350 RepID=UPI0033C81335